MPVAVVVKPSRGCPPRSIVANARLRRHVRERPISVVVVQNGMPVPRHIDVRISIVVEVRHRHPKEESSIRAYPRLLGHIRKRSVTIISVQRWLRRLFWMKEWCKSAVHKKRVQIAVLVVINPANPCPHRLQIQSLFGSRALVMKMNPALLRGVAELHSIRIRFRRSPRAWLALASFPCFRRSLRRP